MSNLQTSVLRPLCLALIACGLIATPVLAADKVSSKTRKPNLEKLVQQMNARLQELESKNAALEQQVQVLRAAAISQAGDAPAPGDAVKLAQRVKTLEEQQNKLDSSLSTEVLSEKEPEIASRLKAVEIQTLEMQKAAKKIDALDGLSASVSFTSVAQKPYGISKIGDEKANSQLNYRGDVSVELPLGDIGNTEQKLSVQFRLGQGRGLNNIPAFAKPNATAFQLTVPDEASIMLAQAWYQAKIPLPFEGHKASSKESLELTFGKIDPFVFFDQNAAANDESKQFINSVFVHNPLLDAGGDIGVDANGFAPGLNISYANQSQKPDSWRFSFGMFGAGSAGSNFQKSLRTPLYIAQIETERRWMGGLPGNYRLYAWRQPQAAHFDEAITQAERHRGWGISVDQRFGDGLTLFGRYGQQSRGNVQVERALTLGVAIDGSYWDRAADGIGFGLAWLRGSDNYASFSGNGKHERVAELFYRYHVSSQFEITPDFQYISRPNGSNEPAIKLFGIRAQVNY